MKNPAMFAPHFPLLQLPSFCHRSPLPLLRGPPSAPAAASVSNSSFRKGSGDRELLSLSSSAGYRNSTRYVKVRSQLRHPIIAPDDYWGTWTALFAIGALGIWYFLSILICLAQSGYRLWLAFIAKESHIIRTHGMYFMVFECVCFGGGL